MAERFGWLAPVSGALAMGLAGAWVGVYAYGSAVPERHRAEAVLRLATPPDRVWALVGDPGRRPEWHADIARIGRIEDRDGRPVWRQLDQEDDRFDLWVVASEPPRQVVLEIADPDQIGLEARWTWTLSPVASGGTEVRLVQEGAVDNPVWRGVWALRFGPYHVVESELTGLATFFGESARPERVDDAG